LREQSSAQIYIISGGLKQPAPAGVIGIVHVLWDGALTQIPAHVLTDQSGWRWCRKCQGLFFGGNPGPVCPAGGSHDSAGSYNYTLVMNSPDAAGPRSHKQSDWRWCRKCQGLFFGGNPDPVCPAGGAHDSAGSYNYTLVMNSPQATGQSGCCWCRKCQGLFFGGNPSPVCPAGGAHDSAGSGNYTLPGI
jgi:hypothetical protein